MLYWQNQLNFADHYAIKGCGVDFNNHLKDTGMIGSLFKFHIYYQIRRILKQMSIALPQDTSWNAFDNSYDQSAYERICNEFNVDVNADSDKSRMIIRVLAEYTITGLVVGTIRLILE